MKDSHRRYFYEVVHGMSSWSGKIGLDALGVLISLRDDRALGSGEMGLLDWLFGKRTARKITAVAASAPVPV